MDNRELYHYGVKGMKWGVRRFQNKDGSLTPAGKKRYSDRDDKSGTDRMSRKELDIRLRKMSADIDDEVDWDTITGHDYEKIVSKHVSKVAQDIYRSCKGDERDEFISSLSSYVDSAIFDDPKVLAIDAKTGVVLKLESDMDVMIKTGRNYRQITSDFLDQYYGHKKGSVDYWTWGDKITSETLDHSAIFNASPDELYHWGIKGMKWGRRRYQNKDGSLTAEGRKRYGEDDPNESVDQKRERLLKSTNAQELYKNRGLLTTNEINDRLNRINTEQRLADLAAKDQKSGYDRVDKMLKLGRKINEVYEFTNTPVMKALKKQLGLDKAEDTIKKAMGVDEVLKKWDKVSDDDVVKALKRANNKKALEKLQKEARDAKDAIKKDLDKEADKKDDEPTSSQNGDADSTPKNNTQTGNWKTQPFVKPNPKSEQEKVNEARDNRVNNPDDTPISKGILYDRAGNEILNQFTDTRAVDIPTATVDSGKKYTDDFLKKLRTGGN